MLLPFNSKAISRHFQVGLLSSDIYYCHFVSSSQPFQRSFQWWWREPAVLHLERWELCCFLLELFNSHFNCGRIRFYSSDWYWMTDLIIPINVCTDLSDWPPVSGWAIVAMFNRIPLDLTTFFQYSTRSWISVTGSFLQDHGRVSPPLFQCTAEVIFRQCFSNSILKIGFGVTWWFPLTIHFSTHCIRNSAHFSIDMCNVKVILLEYNEPSFLQGESRR